MTLYDTNAVLPLDAKFAYDAEKMRVRAKLLAEAKKGEGAIALDGDSKEELVRKQLKVVWFRVTEGTDPKFEVLKTPSDEEIKAKAIKVSGDKDTETKIYQGVVIADPWSDVSDTFKRHIEAFKSSNKSLEDYKKDCSDAYEEFEKSVKGYHDALNKNVTLLKSSGSSFVYNANLWTGLATVASITTAFFVPANVVFIPALAATFTGSLFLQGSYDAAQSDLPKTDSFENIMTNAKAFVMAPVNAFLGLGDNAYKAWMGDIQGKALKSATSKTGLLISVLTTAVAGVGAFYYAQMLPVFIGMAPAVTMISNYFMSSDTNTASKAAESGKPGSTPTRSATLGGSAASKGADNAPKDEYEVAKQVYEKLVEELKKLGENWTAKQGELETARHELGRLKAQENVEEEIQAANEQVMKLEKESDELNAAVNEHPFSFEEGFSSEQFAASMHDKLAKRPEGLTEGQIGYIINAVLKLEADLVTESEADTAPALK